MKKLINFLYLVPNIDSEGIRNGIDKNPFTILENQQASHFIWSKMVMPFGSACPVSQVRLWLKFTKQNELWFQQNLIWKSSIWWGCCGVNLELKRHIFDFSYFRLFLAFDYIVGVVRLSGMSRKVHSCNPHIFIFVLIYSL